VAFDFYKEVDDCNFEETAFCYYDASLFHFRVEMWCLLVIFIEKKYLAGWRLKKLQDKFFGYG